MADSGKKRLVPTDFMKFEFVGDPQISPDASRVAYVRTVVDPKDNKYRSAIMTVPAALTAPSGSGAPISTPFTSGITPDSSPRWSPDGAYLAFLSGRDAGVGDDEAKKKAGAQLWVAPTGGGEARPITAIKGGVTEYVWSPDSRFIAFAAGIKPEGPEWLDEKPKDKADEASAVKSGDMAVEAATETPGDGASPETKPDKAADPDDFEALFKKHTEGVKHITRVFYRLDGMGYLENRRSQVFVIDVQAALAGFPGAGPAVKPVQVTSGDFDHTGPAFSPDGKSLAVSACRDDNPDLQKYADIWVFRLPEVVAAPAEGGEAKPAALDANPKRLTARTGPFHSPSWSPDGKQVAFLGHENELTWYTDDKLWLVEIAKDGVAKEKPRCLTKEFGRAFGDQSISDMRVGGGDTRPAWSPDGKVVFLLASDRGTTHLHAVEVANGRVSQLTTGDWVIFGWSADASRRNFAFSLARPENPNDIYVGRIPETSAPAKWPLAPAGMADLDIIARQPVTRTNVEFLKSRFVSRPERFTFNAQGGPLIDGWAIKPVGYSEGERYPAVLEIHGGPMAMYAGSFFLEFQLLAASGIGVIFCNPRGSQGYGEEFCAGIKEEWGKNDYADILACVNQALALFPWVDEDRLGVAGGSYGGYMTTWVIGHTDRFKAACSMRAVNNCHSFFGTSDTGFHWEDIWHGTPWKDWEKLIQQSPITYAANIKTPTLVIHNEEDHRCLIEQGEQLFAALKKLGVEAEFVRYPGESHGLSRGGKPWHRVHRLKSIVEWFERKLKPAPVKRETRGKGKVAGR